MTPPVRFAGLSEASRVIIQITRKTLQETVNEEVKMIHFVVTRPHTYTVWSLGGGFGANTPPCKALPYDDLFDSRRVPAGTYIFCDIERLSDHDLLLAAEAYGALSAAAPRCRVLNDPARVKIRYALLRSLKEGESTCLMPIEQMGIPGQSGFRSSFVRKPITTCP